MSDNQKYVQAQPFTLAGSGAVIGATSITLNSFARLDGTVITMTDIGNKGFMTLEPGNSTKEEAITFSGITANANGTVTLTGVKTQLTYAPYTETSGLAKTHVGATPAILTNTAGFYDELTSKADDETITGQWDFTQSPTGPLPISASTTALATVGYVNNVAIAGAPDAATTVKGISKLSVAPLVATNPIVVGDNDTRVPTQGENNALVGDETSIPVGSSNVFVTQTGLQNQAETYALSTGTSTAYVVSYSPVPVSLATGQRFSFKAHAASGGSPTLNVNSLGAKSLVKMGTTGTTVLVVGDFGTNMMVIAEYNGNEFQIIGPPAGVLTTPGLSKNGVFTKNTADASTSQTIAHGLGKIPSEVIMFMTSAGNMLSTGIYNGATTATSFVGNAIGPVKTSGTDTSNIIVYQDATGAVIQSQNGSITVDATNITITWTKTNSPTGSATIAWKATSNVS